ncbi:hypothetical protein SE17_23215 [Kouleothrix aurantiaca]|uniref:Uncharacterized protein n=1 Tax=Kouleothrix aurantiaca TaxID=186479 RepID=A0A0P9CXM8_9CHLR|nr:hypothetical protein SE17_23215 [Kouleothrix aurantiaca]
MAASPASPANGRQRGEGRWPAGNSSGSTISVSPMNGPNDTLIYSQATSSRSGSAPGCVT